LATNTASLTALNGPDEGQVIDLNGREWILGRLPECEIVISVGAVSRKHAKLTREAGRFYLEDLGSRNGTLLNDQMLTAKTALRTGDRVKICDIEYKFYQEEPSTTATAPASALARTIPATVMIDDGINEAGGAELSKFDVSSGQFQIGTNPEARLRAMLEITQSLGKTLSLDDVLPKVLDSCFKLFLQADRGLILLRTDDGKIIPRWNKFRRQTEDETIRVSRTIINHVIDTKSAILLEDAANDAQFSMSQSIADFKIRSVMCAPLIDSSGKAFGALQIDTLDRRGRFKSDDLEVLVSIATQAAIAIDNAQLYETALQQQTLQRDLELAREVQKGFLPDCHPSVPGYSFYNYYEPMVYVGGDYYDYVPLRDGRLAIIVADVVGHGVAAAMMMAKLSAETRFSLISEETPAKAVRRLNQRIAALGVDRFITFIMVVLDPTQHRLTVVSAGHMAPIIRRADGRIEEPGEDDGGLPLGVFDDSEYEEVQSELQPGDVVVLYTDGVNEASLAANDQFGIDRMRDLIRGSNHEPQTVGQTVIDAVRAYLGEKQQDDDMCLVSFGRHA
jgi:sigma-B regulation protein RsbU (phosphoserine phosphatase)